MKSLSECFKCFKKPEVQPFFGLTLQLASNHPNNVMEHIPYPVWHLLQYLETEKGFHCSGLYRIPGSALQIQELQKLYDTGQEPKLHNYGVSPCASLLKKYFKMLPDPLLTFEEFDNFMRAAERQDEKERIDEIKKIKDRLPEVNKKVIERLFIHLRHVAAYSHVNKMSISNLAIVFAPTLLKGRNETMVQLLKNTPKMTTVVHHLISDYNTIFPEVKDSIMGEEKEAEEDEVNLEDEEPKKKVVPDHLIMIDLSKPLDSLLGRIRYFRRKANRPDDIEEMSAKELKLEKRLIKKELKSFDNVYKEFNKRLPNKEEKEPLRPLYNRYKKVKQRLDKMESEEPQSKAPERKREREVEESATEMKERKNVEKGQNTVLRLTRNKKVQQELNDNEHFQGLLKKKRKLQKELRNFQKEFEKTHNRKPNKEERKEKQSEFEEYKKIKKEMEKITKNLESEYI